MSAVWDSGQYDGGALLVLLAMADYADDKHECWPSVSALARKSRLSDRQVNRILRQLRDDGAITPTGRYPTTQGTPIVVYRINVETFKGDMVSPIGAAKGDMVSPLEPAKGDICDTLRVTFDALRVTPMSDDPSLDPPIEPIEEDCAAAPTAAAAVSDSESTAKGLVDLPPIAIYRDTFLRTPSKAQMSWLMAQEITDLRRWLETCQLWVGKGWSATNLQGMVDLYRNPARIAELRSYRGANNEATTTRRAATNARTAGGAGGVLASRQVGVNGAGANGYHGAAAGHAPATAFLIETDDDGADDEF